MISKPFRVAAAVFMVWKPRVGRITHMGQAMVNWLL